MANLYEMNCVRPKKTDALSPAEVTNYLSEIPDWKVVEREGIPRLERVFRFKNFVDALQFTNQIGALAEEQDHHPAILTEWGRVTVTFWTHFTGGLHLNDFIMAARTDRI